MDINPTYLIQLGLYLLSLVVLNGILFKPFLKVIKEREALTGGVPADVEQFRAQAAQDRAEYQRRMRQAQRDAEEARDALREQGREEERKILAEARGEVAAKLGAARQEVAQAEDQAKGQLGSEARDLGRSLVAKVLDREVAA